MEQLILFVFTFSLMSVALYASSKLLKTKKRDFVTSFSAAFVYSVGNTILGLLLPSGESYAILPFFLVLALLFAVIKAFYDETFGKTLLLLFLSWMLASIAMMFVGVILWQAGVFSPEG